MNKLWAPWRYEYIKNTISGNSEGCLFCNIINENNDKENLIVCRGKKSYIIINRYPYNNGHLMIVPYNHFSEVEMLSDEEILEMMKFLKLSIKVLSKKFSPEGFNIGVNLGKVAGAGIDDHIHLHIVPRWTGDTNFMPVLGDTKIISQNLQETWKIIKEGFDEIKIGGLL